MRSADGGTSANRHAISPVPSARSSALRCRRASPARRLRSDTSPAGQVDARLDRHDHARRERPVLVGGQPRLLRGPRGRCRDRAMTERLCHSRPCRSLRERPHRHRLHDRTGANRRDRGTLGSEHNSIHLLKFRREFTGHQNTGQVAVIEPAPGPPVDQHEVESRRSCFPDRPTVRQRRPRTDANDRRERSARAAEAGESDTPVRRRSSFSLRPARSV